MLIEMLTNKTKETSMKAIYYGGHPEFPCEAEQIYVKLKRDRMILVSNNSRIT